MYLTKIGLDRRNPSVMQALRNCQDMHRNTMSLFGAARKDANVLYRIRLNDKDISQYVLSKEPPVSPKPNSGMQIIGTVPIDRICDSFEAGRVFAFDLLAAPTKKLAALGHKNSRRITLRTQEEREAWLRSKGAQNGFETVWVREDGTTKQFGTNSGNAMFIGAVQFRGVLRVTDAEKFKNVYLFGIGPGKAYGLGMLLLSRP